MLFVFYDILSFALTARFSDHQMPTFRAYNAKNANPVTGYAELMGAAPAKLEVSIDYFMLTIHDSESAALFA